LLALLLLAGPTSPACAQAGQFRRAAGDHIKQQASAVLGLMSYMVVPDVTTSSLSLSNADTGNPSVAMTQLGGGFTWSRSTPVYMEGNAAYVRFDPKFLVSDGTETRDLPVRWNGASVTVGLGWDFFIAQDLVFRPIVMGSYGRIVSDAKAGLWFLANRADAEISFLDGGKVYEYGAGGALMLDFERLRPERDLDLEVRYTRVDLHMRSDDLPDMRSTATAESFNIWGRVRTPTGVMLLDRPLRSVLELTHSEFLGSQTSLLGFDRLTSLGAGLEIDLSAHDVFVTRGRALVRYLRGQGVEGWSLGLAVSF
jgi:hypothetical protein